MPKVVVLRFVKISGPFFYGFPRRLGMSSK